MDTQVVDGVYCIGLTDAASGWRCINCGVFETSRDFSFRVGPQDKVQFQIPLCEDCRLHSVVPQKIYNPDMVQFRSFFQLTIVCDLLDIYNLFKQRHPEQSEQVEIMMVN